MDASLSLELVRHLSTVGFVYLTNHGVDESLIRSTRQSAADFFASETATKSAFAVSKADPDRPFGYRAIQAEKNDLNQVRNVTHQRLENGKRVYSN